MVTTLSGDYGYSEYWLKSATGTTVAAATADWHISATEKAPAINIYNSTGTVFDGGEIHGEMSLTANWTDIYNHMSTGFRIANSPNTTIRNVHIDQTWDGIRFIPSDSLNVADGNSNGWLVEDVYMHNIRDDAIENDFAMTGTLRDSLLDGVMSAFGTVNDQSAHGTLTVDDSIIIMKAFNKDGDMTHGSPFKFNTATPGNNPDLKIVNTIIAIEDPTHNGFSRLKEAWAHLTESSGNYLLNLSDTKLPSNYPLPPKGFTILQGQAARDFLATEKAKWLAEHDGPQAGSPTTTAPIAPTTDKTVLNSDGTKTVITTDTDSSTALAQTWSTYSKSGLLMSKDLVNSDGSHTFIDFDETGAASWSQSWFNYDKAGRLSSQDAVMDNGAHTFTNFDETGSAAWSSDWFSYDAQGRLAGEDVVYDNGAHTVINIDEANSQSWSQAWFNYDAQGRLDTQDVINDDHSHVFTNYDQAGTEAFQWSAMVYDTAGHAVQQTVMWDSGQTQYYAI